MIEIHREPSHDSSVGQGGGEEESYNHGRIDVDNEDDDEDDDDEEDEEDPDEDEDDEDDHRSDGMIDFESKFGSDLNTLTIISSAFS